MALDDFLDESQTHAIGLIIRRLIIRRGLEFFKYREDGLPVFGFYADAVILDVKDILFRAVRRLHDFQETDFNERLLFVIVFDGISNKVAEDLGYSRVVAGNIRQGGGDKDTRISL